MLPLLISDKLTPAQVSVWKCFVKSLFFSWPWLLAQVFVWWKQKNVLPQEMTVARLLLLFCCFCCFCCCCCCCCCCCRRCCQQRSRSHWCPIQYPTKWSIFVDSEGGRARQNVSSPQLLPPRTAPSCPIAGLDSRPNAVLKQSADPGEIGLHRNASDSDLDRCRRDVCHIARWSRGCIQQVRSYNFMSTVRNKIIPKPSPLIADSQPSLLVWAFSMMLLEMRRVGPSTA